MACHMKCLGVDSSKVDGAVRLSMKEASASPEATKLFLVFSFRGCLVVRLAFSSAIHLNSIFEYGEKFVFLHLGVQLMETNSFSFVFMFLC